MDQTAKHVIFAGRVQGVGFRFTSQNIARRHLICGYVRNLADGTVEMLVQGAPQEVSGCIKDIQDSFAGYIRETKVEQIPYNSRYTDFRITF